MQNFGIGLALGLAGFSSYVILDIALGISAWGNGDADPLLVAGFWVALVSMVGGPITYWVILPVVNRLRRR